MGRKHHNKYIMNNKFKNILNYCKIFLIQLKSFNERKGNEKINANRTIIGYRYI